MGLFDTIMSAIGGGGTTEDCPKCGSGLDNEDLVAGSFWCGACGSLYKTVGGELVDVKDLRDSGGPGGECASCGNSLAGSDSYLPYENGSNEYAYIECRSCGFENIREGFGE